MTKALKAVICVGLSCICLFLAVGYAALTDMLTVTGDVAWEEPKVIYITNIAITDASGATGAVSIDKLGYVSLSSNYILNAKDSVTFDVTVKNNSGVDQIFDIVTKTDNLNYTITVDNQDPNDDAGKNAQGTVVPSDETYTFKITITNNNNSALTISGNEGVNQGIVNTLQFVLDEDSLTEQAAAGIAEAFTELLNKEKDSYVVNGEEKTPEEILTLLDEQMTSNANNSISDGGFAANFNEANLEDKTLINAIFGENTTLKIGEEEREVKLMIKEQEVTRDGNGTEMVLYVTTDTLEEGGTGNIISGTTNDVPVYAIVFGQVPIIDETTGETTYQWQQLGDILAGEAPVSNYTGYVNIYGGTGSFNTNYWTSTEFTMEESNFLGQTEIVDADIQSAYTQSKELNSTT